ncbi:hypothetical protein LP417_22210 [Polaromonas sp. P1-6]|nr:hypothetical protein LP417_22210 [Polaromonas sp. P1-6]
MRAERELGHLEDAENERERDGEKAIDAAGHDAVGDVLCDVVHGAPLLAAAVVDNARQ